jgi:hypothetical protein
MSSAPERITVGILESGDLVIDSRGAAIMGHEHVAYIAEAEAATLRAKLAEARADALREAAEVAMGRHRERMIALGRNPDDYHSDGVVIHDAILARIAEDAK